MELVLVNVDEYSPLLGQPSIPMPIGGLTLFFAILIGYLCSILYRNNFRNVFSPVKLLIFYFLVVLPISIYAVGVSSLSLPRLVQMLLPMVFISLLSFPSFLKDRIDLLKITLLGAFLFFNLHFLSVFFTSKDILNVNDRQEFSSFFGTLIYQSLVSYPAVLSLYLFLTVALIYVTRKEMLLAFKKYKYFYYYFIPILLYLLAASGRRAFLVEYISSFIIILIFSIYYLITNRHVKKKTLWLLFLFIVLFISFFVFYTNTSLSQRVLISIQENTFDSGRISILGNAYDYYSANLSVFFFGGGTKDAPGFHNFILDQIYRVGVVGMTFVYVTMAFLIRRFVKINDLGTKYKYQRSVFLFILLGALFLQSMINASVSQPYYFVNFLIVTVFVYFVLFSKSNNRLK